MATPISKVTLTIDNKDYIFGIQQATNQTKTFGNEAAAAFNRADTASNKFNLSANNLTGGLIKLRGTLATIGLGAFALSAIKSADEVDALSKATDISIAKLLEFKTAMQQNGMEAADAGKSITSFYGNITEANQGSDKMQETFAKLGVSLKDLKSLSESDLLDKTIRGFENIKDPAEKSATAVSLFGKGFKTGDMAGMAQSLDDLRGKYEEQERSITAAADAVDKFEGIINTLKIAVVQALEPLLSYFKVLDDGQVNVGELSTRIRQLGVIIGAYFAGSAILGAVKGVMALAGAFRALGVAQAFASAGVTLIAGAAAALAAGVALDKIMGNPIGIDLGTTPNPADTANLSAAEGDRKAEEAARIRDKQNKERDRERRNREQQIGKELQGQLNAVNGLMDGYKRAAQANMDRYTTEVDLLGKTEYEQELIKGTADIEKKYADQIAALEEKKKGAKGATLALIQKSISDLNDLKTSELDIFEITRGQIFNYKQQQEEIKRITDGIDKQIERQQALGDIIRGINDKKVDIKFEQGLKGLSPLQKQIAEIQESARKAALEAGRSFSAKFDSEDGLTPDRAKELADGLELIAQGYRDIAQAQIDAVVNVSPLMDAWTEYKNNALDTGSQIKASFSNFTNGMEDAIVKFVMTGKLSFKDLAQSVIADLARIAAKRAIVAIGTSLFGFANGGDVMAKTPIIVGERGPELFIPQAAGNIVSNATLKGSGGSGDYGGGQTIVNYSIQAVDASSFRSLVARDPSFIYAVTEQGRRSQPTRRGF